MSVEKLYIFDLDGTLYEGTDHFDYYAKRLAIDVEEKNLESFWRDYEKSKIGDHILAIGKAYDVEEDAVLTVDPMTLRVVEAHNWDGTAWPSEKVEQVYDRDVEFDFEKIVAIGDGWWLPFACAKHYGVDNCYKRYVETKEYMVTDEFQLDPIPGLRDFLLRLGEKTNIVLMTNSDADDVGRLFKELDLEGVFPKVITSAKKPSLTDHYFNELKNEYSVAPSEVVSVGDNFINEIAPALLQEMKAVYISAHGNPVDHDNLIQVNRITDWVENFKF
ncbi:HAD family hydrolase [Alteribacter natronophilus]|uniref:HAD family hydrolase n=1 Tax=Alteribacter natronophilus TaxID=2583810 RepID=UPI00110E0C4C|nr:HAD family hydrolase [Alteribacter natronophilus]TMW71553.1 HAD family hydrolase [Alteribacter natronophilus]